MTAQDIIDFANKNGIKITRGGIGLRFDGSCARAVVYEMFLGPREVGGNTSVWGLYDIYEEVPFSEQKLESLESGFERSTLWGEVDAEFYQMGQEVARLAGL